MQGPSCLDPGVWSPQAQVACCLLPIVLEGPKDDWNVATWSCDSSKNVERGTGTGEAQCRCWPVVALEPVLRELWEYGPPCSQEILSLLSLSIARG